MVARIEHVNLVVYSIQETMKFMEAALPQWRIRGSGESEWYGHARSWVHFGTDRFYLTFNDGALGAPRDLRGVTPGLAHVGLEVDDVGAVIDRLTAKGYEIATIGAEHPHRKSVYFIDPAGTEYEFIEYLSEQPAARNQYGGETSAIQRIATEQARTALR